MRATQNAKYMLDYKYENMFNKISVKIFHWFKADAKATSIDDTAEQWEINDYIQTTGYLEWE